MERARIEELWARALSGDALSESEKGDLLDALAADPSLRAQFLGDERVDGALRTMGRTGKDGQRFAQRFLDHVVAERDKEEFAAKVWTRLEGRDSSPSKPPPAPSQVPQAKSTRRSTRRSTLGERRGGWGENNWVRLAAACLILAALVFATRSRWSGGPSGEDQKAAKSPPPQRSPGQTPDSGAKGERVKVQETPDAPRPDAPETPKDPAVVKTPRASDPDKPSDLPKEQPPKEEKVVKPAPQPPVVPKRTNQEDPRKDATVTAVAQLSEVRGTVFVLRDTVREPAQAGQPLLAGAGLETSGPASAVVLTFPDLTRVEIGGDTEVRDLQGTGPRGKSFFLARGRVEAEVAKQAKGLPMILRTPQGEAKVMGTQLRLHVDATGKGSTRLDVSEGLVELKRSLDGKTVEVPSGHYAVAAPGVELILRPVGIVAQWDFEEGKGLLARDSSEGAHDAKLIGAARVPWKRGRALSFNGRDSFIDCGTGPAIKGTGPMTVTAWVRTSSTDKQVILQQRSPEEFDGEYQLKVTTGGKLHWWTMARKGGEIGVYSDKSVSDGKWHHVAASREKDGTLRIFIDGKPSGAPLTAPPVILKEIAVYIGADPRDRNMYFEGEIDDVRIYERALTPQETATLAASER